MIDSIIFKAFDLVVKKSEKNSTFNPSIIIMNNESSIHDGKNIGVNFMLITQEVVKIGLSNELFERTDSSGVYVLSKKGLRLKKSKKSISDFLYHLNKKSVFSLKNIALVITVICTLITTILGVMAILN
ncbi:hypothetical protein [Formosa algae]|uniref:hypothetical protein n=1 Tax=Formosa algae TaxID=225843 RepID=UPI000CCFADBF|nr:hypothetical protein [Formosa algae]PNW28941.1 hypothetical protein BKP44_06785 [Formosa algae]